MSQVSLLPHSTPEAQGVPAGAISAFVSAVEREIDALHSFMLLRHGHVIAEGWWDPYRATDQHILFSLSKSFTSTAIGLLVAESKLSIDTPVLEFFPEDAPPTPSANLQAMRVRDLLSMATGHALDTTEPMTTHPSGNWVRGFLAQPVEHAPGTHFVYNSGATYMLSAIVQTITGGRMIEYLKPRLFAPLGIANPRWESSPQGIDVGGWGLMITTANIAAFGQLYLQRGNWRGQQLIPASWIDTATASQVANPNEPNIDWRQGYGYQFWRCRHGAYRGDGAFGQYCIVMPEQDVVLAITAGLGDMQPPLNLVWEHLLPAMADAPLPEDPAAQADLTNTLAHLQLRTPQGSPSSPTATRVSGKHFSLVENSAQISEICFDFEATETLIRIHNNHGDQQIGCGHQQWVRRLALLGPFDGSTYPIRPRPIEQCRIGASGAWVDPQTYSVKMWWHEMPFARTLTCHFEGDQLIISQQNHVGFGPIELSQLHGKIENA